MDSFGTGSVEPHAGEKWDRTASLSDVPSEVFLEDALTLETKGREQSIQTALGRVGLPATIEESDETGSDLSDEVAVEVDT